jgi:dienelactone hydrolase
VPIRSTVRLTHEGAQLEGQLLLPERREPGSAVLIMPTAVGLKDYEVEQARRLSELGHVAMVADMYGGGVHYNIAESAGVAFTALLEAPRTLRDRVVAWFELLKSRPDVDPARVAAIGYCFGGKCVLELARSGADVKAVVSFHGLLRTAIPAEAGAIKAEVAIYTGTEDPFVPRADVDAARQELIAAGARWQLTEFGGVSHAFTEPDAASYGREGIAYDALAARLSWTGMLALLDATIA